MTSASPRPFRRACGVFTVLALLASGSALADIPQAQRDYLLAFHAATGGANWTQQDHWGGPLGTECTWYGVTCEPCTPTKREQLPRLKQKRGAGGHSACTLSNT